MDLDYVEALERDLSPISGIEIGAARLVML